MALGTVVAVTGILLVVVGLVLYYHEGSEIWDPRPYLDIGDKLYDFGIVLVVLGCVICVASAFAKPSRLEALQAQRLMEENRDRLSGNPDVDDSTAIYESIITESHDPRDKKPSKHCRYCGLIIPKDSILRALWKGSLRKGHRGESLAISVKKRVPERGRRVLRQLSYEVEDRHEHYECQCHIEDALPADGAKARFVELLPGLPIAQ